MVSVAPAPPARTPKPRAQLRKQRDGKQGPWVPPDRAARLNDQLAASAAYSCVVVDGNNVRGLNGFRWSAPRLQALVRAWARNHEFEGRVVIVWDHGAAPGAFTADGVGLAFAGPRATADDVIAVQTGAILDSGVQRVWLATSDRELIERAMTAGSSAFGAGGAARKQAAHARVRVISSGDFAALIAPPEEAAFLAPAPVGPVPLGAGDGSLALSSPAAAAALLAAAVPPAVSLGLLAPELLLLAEFGQSEAELRERALLLLPTRARLKQRRVRQRRGAANGGTSVVRGSFKEKTWHRVVLAERLRRLLARAEAVQVASGEGAGSGGGNAVGWLDQYAFAYNLALGDGGAQPRPLLDDRRLDAEGRTELLRFARALCEAETAGDEEGGPVGAATGAASSSAVVGGEAEAAQLSAQLGAALPPKFKITRRERRLLRSSRSRHADVHSSVHPKSGRDAALAALDRWLARGSDDEEVGFDDEPWP